MTDEIRAALRMIAVEGGPQHARRAQAYLRKADLNEQERKLLDGMLHAALKQSHTWEYVSERDRQQLALAAITSAIQTGQRDQVLDTRLCAGQRLGLTLRQLGDAAGMSHTAIWKRLGNA